MSFYTLSNSNLSKDDKLILPLTHLATMTSNERLHKRLLLTYATFNITELPHDRGNRNACRKGYKLTNQYLPSNYTNKRFVASFTLITMPNLYHTNVQLNFTLVSKNATYNNMFPILRNMYMISKR